VANLAYQSTWEPDVDLNVMLPATMLPIATLTAPKIPSLLENNWLVDTGCSNHASCQKETFWKDTLGPYNEPAINGFGGASQQPEMIGTAQIPCDVGGKRVNLLLSNTLYQPNAGCNIISTSQLWYVGAQLTFLL
jgi:hypothetical protein